MTAAVQDSSSVYDVVNDTFWGVNETFEQMTTSTRKAMVFAQNQMENMRVYLPEIVSKGKSIALCKKMGLALKGAHIARVATSVAFKALGLAALPGATIRAIRAFSFLHGAYLTFKEELDDGYNTFDHIFFASKEAGVIMLELFFPIATMLADTFALLDHLAQKKLSPAVYVEFKLLKASMQKAAITAFAGEFFGFRGFDSVGSKFKPIEVFSKFLKFFFK